MLEVDSTGSSQGGLKCAGPLLVGPGETEYLVRCQSEVAERRPELLPGVDRLQKLVSHLERETGLCFSPAPLSGGVALQPSALGATAACVPAGHRAVGCPRAVTTAARIGEITDLV